MLITTTKNISTISSAGGAYIAHVIRTPNEGSTSSKYVLGLSYSTGEPIGLMLQSTKVALRHWARLSSVEEYLFILESRLVSITMIPSHCPVDNLKKAFISLFKLDEPVADEVLNTERLDLLAALSPQRQSDDGTTRDTANA